MFHHHPNCTLKRVQKQSENVGEWRRGRERKKTERRRGGRETKRKRRDRERGRQRKEAVRGREKNALNLSD